MELLLIAASLAVWTLIGASDLIARRVPTLLLVTLFGLQLALLIAGVSPSDGFVGNWVLAVSGLALTAVIFFPLWCLGLMGAGDVKFLAVLGFALGPVGVFASWLIASVLAGVHSVLVITGGLLMRTRTGQCLRAEAQGPWLELAVRLAPARAWIQARRGSRRGTPYATYLAIGALLWVFVLYDQYRY